MTIVLKDGKRICYVASIEETKSIKGSDPMLILNFGMGTPIYVDFEKISTITPDKIVVKKQPVFDKLVLSVGQPTIGNNNQRTGGYWVELHSSKTDDSLFQVSWGDERGLNECQVCDSPDEAAYMFEQQANYYDIRLYAKDRQKLAKFQDTEA